ncbi:g-type lectin s-receptor-like serine/threonine-protein kinase sd2-2 [Quercus suber]|uniref:G-type lectin s-receptor-like serine/threonine-protein kinase sd2-2 n=1 Tax=Quercus suber TaxID=58331 RepID=A0AAW0MDS2_QUESU
MKKKPTENMSHPPPLFVSLIALLLISITATSASNGTVLIVRGNATITSVNKTFELGFFNTNGDSNYYLGIWYTSVTPKTYVWVANRNTPTKNLDTSSFELNRLGQLAVKASENVTVWQSSNLEAPSFFQFRDDGNLVLLSPDRTVAWQSFDHPTDTWLPGMNLTRDKVLTCWKSVSDPSPGFYSLRLNPHDYGEFELVYNSTEEYWTTGNWTGQSFSNVPEMNAPYIYRFNFVDPFSPTASFGFKVMPDPTGSVPLSMFRIVYDGRLHQYTWSNPNENWYQFWVQPVDMCHVYGLCGSFGFCGGGGLRTCECVGGFKPRNDAAWETEDYTGGCVRENLSCGGNDESFRGIGTVRFDGAEEKSFVVDKGGCEMACLKNCECIGLYYNERSRLCTNLYGSLLNLQKLNYSVGGENMLYVRVDSVKKVRKSLNLVGLIGSIVGSVLFLGFVGVMGFVLVKRKWNGVIEEDTQQIIEGNIGAVVDSRLGGAYVFEEVKRVALVAVWCIQDNEVMRPTMGMVVKMLEGLVEVTVPPAPKLLQALVSGESFCGVRAESGNGVSSGSGFYGVDGVAAMSSGGSESSLGNVSSPGNKNVNA